ncbi:FMRFamide-activated amiloride-sensitive sodium channel [Caerostris extrusa]|uniref:FMRFamide-activated amiloride-sensitive sodium channel n=1 Tax=Caerostris extrusa TaxID=172846 RepID=A0AAV4NMX9_CAEEX|nr:FMRFamide-activated amiloride-sensitive sodium channel [Caerostris extrusa]
MTSCKTKEDGTNKPSEGEKVSLPIKSLEDDQENFKTIAFNLLTNSSVYAVAQLVSSSGCGRKLLWFVVLVVGVLGCSYEVYRFLSLYFQYPVVITLEVQNTWKLNFPAVTVCNLNRNFTNFLSIEFGNCFTFNGKYGIDAGPLQTPYIGPNSGLELTLNLKSPDYSPITASVGARVVINKADSQPNPEDHGINISPGFETSVALKQTSIHRLPHPYRDKCRSYEKQSLDYSKDQEDCIRKCMQKVNLHRCGCVDPFLPVTNSSKLCDLKIKPQVRYLNEYSKLFR